MDGLTFCSCGMQLRRAPCALPAFLPLPVHQKTSWFLPHSINNGGWMVLLSVLAGCSHAALHAHCLHSRLYQFIKKLHGSYLTLLIMLDGWSYFLFLRDAVTPRSMRRLHILACTSSSKNFMVLTSLYTMDGCFYFLFLRDAVTPRSMRRLHILACTSSSKNFIVHTSFSAMQSLIDLDSFSVVSRQEICSFMICSACAAAS